MSSDEGTPHMSLVEGGRKGPLFDDWTPVDVTDPHGRVVSSGAYLWYDPVNGAPGDRASRCVDAVVCRGTSADGYPDRVLVTRVGHPLAVRRHRPSDGCHTGERCRIGYADTGCMTGCGLEPDGEYRCSACGNPLPDFMQEVWGDVAAGCRMNDFLRFCPSCGAEVDGWHA